MDININAKARPNAVVNMHYLHISPYTAKQAQTQTTSVAISIVNSAPC